MRFAASGTLVYTRVWLLQERGNKTMTGIGMQHASKYTVNVLVVCQCHIPYEIRNVVDIIVIYIMITIVASV